MKQASVGMKVLHCGREGMVESVGQDGHCTVLFARDWPFPERVVVRVADLKRATARRPIPVPDPDPDFEEAPF
jgi:hypothetical protein